MQINADLSAFNGRLEIVQIISEFESKVIETIQNKKQKEKRIKL